MSAGGIDSEYIVTIVGLGVSAFGVVMLFLGTRGKTRAEAKAQMDARIDERVSEELKRVYQRIDEIEADQINRTRAFTNILRAIAAQWEGERGPDLDPDDLSVIEDTIPPRWVRGNRVRR